MYCVGLFDYQGGEFSLNQAELFQKVLAADRQAQAIAQDAKHAQETLARMNSDGTLIALCGDEKTLIYGHDPETDTAWLLEQLGPDTVHGLSRNDSRYAVLFLGNGKNQILLDDWNPPNT